VVSYAFHLVVCQNCRVRVTKRGLYVMCRYRDNRVYTGSYCVSFGRPGMRITSRLPDQPLAQNKVADLRYAGQPCYRSITHLTLNTLNRHAGKRLKRVSHS
jgi:hypothetical protein